MNKTGLINSDDEPFYNLSIGKKRVTITKDTKVEFEIKKPERIPIDEIKQKFPKRLNKRQRDFTIKTINEIDDLLDRIYKFRKDFREINKKEHIEDDIDLNVEAKSIEYMFEWIKDEIQDLKEVIIKHGVSIENRRKLTETNRILVDLEEDLEKYK